MNYITVGESIHQNDEIMRKNRKNIQFYSPFGVQRISKETLIIIMMNKMRDGG